MATVLEVKLITEALHRRLSTVSQVREDAVKKRLRLGVQEATLRMAEAARTAEKAAILAAVNAAEVGGTVSALDLNKLSSLGGSLRTIEKARDKASQEVEAVEEVIEGAEREIEEIEEELHRLLAPAPAQQQQPQQPAQQQQPQQPAQQQQPQQPAQQPQTGGIRALLAGLNPASRRRQ